MNADDFADRFVTHDAGPAWELRLALDLCVGRALGADPSYRVPPAEAAAILREAAALLDPPAAPARRWWWR